MTRHFIVLLCTLFLGLSVNSSFARCAQNHRISTTSGEDVVNFCEDPGAKQVIYVKTTARGMPVVYVLTDQTGKIIKMSHRPYFNVTNVPGSVLRIYSVIYLGGLQYPIGEIIDEAEFAKFCFEVSKNYVEIIRVSADESNVFLENNDTTITTCTGDGEADVLAFFTDITTPNYLFVITDDNGMIMDTASGTYNFEGAAAGICRIYGLSYSGDLQVMLGADIATADLAEGCERLSNNYITVHRIAVDGGTVAGNGGERVVICVGDTLGDYVVMTNTSMSGGDYTYVITDENNVILKIDDSDTLAFTDADPGVCRIWGLSHVGDINAEPGDGADTVMFTDICFDLSENYVEVVRTEPDGGTIATAAGDSIVYTCPADGNPDVIAFENTSGSGAHYTHVITDENLVVLAINPDSEIDFEGAGEGTCLVWGLSYTGNLNIMVGDTVGNAPLTDDCFDLTDNYVTLYRSMPDGGTVSLEGAGDTVSVCVGDGMADVFQAANDSESDAKYGYVVTDEENVILAYSPDGMIDFEGASGGVCRVWGLSFTGNVVAMGGDDADSTILTDDCYDLSDNYVTVIRNEVDGGEISTADGNTEIGTCPGDGNADVVHFTSTSAAGNYVYLVTVETDTLLYLVRVLPADSVDFDTYPEGSYHVFGLSFTGSTLPDDSTTLDDFITSLGCFDLSDNHVTVDNMVPAGAEVSTAAGDTAVTVCVIDGMTETLVVQSSSSGLPHQWIVTDANDLIIANQTSDTLELSSNLPDVCRIYRVDYTGAYTGIVGQNVNVIMLSDNCFALSVSYVEVTKVTPDGGMVATSDGFTNVTICPGDSIANVIHFITSSESDPYQYIVTDEDNVILAVPSDSVDFNEAEPGICRVWGVAYVGEFIGEVGDSVGVNPIVDGCMALSSNYIQVNRFEAEAGMVMTSDSLTEVMVITGDTIPDSIFFMSVGASMANYRFVVTDTNDQVLVILNNDFANFEGLPPGIARVYGISFTGTLLLSGGELITEAAISDECYDLSDNFITVTSASPIIAPDWVLNGGQSPFWSVNPFVREMKVYVMDDVNFDTDVRYRVIDFNGRLMAEGTLPQGDRSVRIDSGDWNGGMYVMYWYSGRHTGQIKLIKQ